MTISARAYRSIRNLILTAVLSGAVVFSALSSPGARAEALSDEQTAAVGEIIHFINGFDNLQGEFTQIGPTGSVAKGIFFLSKPGRMRFEYAAPFPWLIVSDGSWVVIKNRAKDKADEFPLSQTPLRLVLGKDVNLWKETNILAVAQADGITTVTIEDRKALVPGQLVLVYDSNQDTLQEWIIIDGKGRRTTVQFQNLVAGIEADPKLFKVSVKRSPDQKKN